MKLMSVVLLAAIAVYIGIYIYSSADNPLKTTMAVRYTAEESAAAEGYIVRTETVLTGEGGAVTLVASEAEKVASGQAVAITYEGESALKRASEIRSLQLQISAAEEELNASSEVKSVSAEDTVLALSSAVQHGNFENLPKLTYCIRNLIFNEDSKITAADINALKDRLSRLMAQNTDTKTITSPMSGVFSAVVDGYEATGPEALRNITPSSLKALFEPTPKPGRDVLGKLITEITWYYAAIMNQSDAERLRPNLVDDKPAVVQFTKSYNAKLKMAVNSIGEPENGKCVVVFSANTNMSDITTLRRLTAQVLFNTYSGLLVPKDAVHYETGEGDDRPYVYLLTGLRAEKVPITILCEKGDSYIVQDGAENKTALREGSEIIVTAKDLYDGKVVKR